MAAAPCHSYHTQTQSHTIKRANVWSGWHWWVGFKDCGRDERFRKDTVAPNPCPAPMHVYTRGNCSGYTARQSSLMGTRHSGWQGQAGKVAKTKVWIGGCECAGVGANAAIGGPPTVQYPPVFCGQGEAHTSRFGVVFLLSKPSLTLCFLLSCKVYHHSDGWQ